MAQPKEPPIKDVLLSLIAIFKEDIFEFKANFDEDYSEFQRLELNKEQVIEKFNMCLEENVDAKSLWNDAKSRIIYLEFFATTKPLVDIIASSSEIKRCIRFAGFDILNNLHDEAFKFFIKTVANSIQSKVDFGMFNIFLIHYIYILEDSLSVLLSSLEKILAIISTHSNVLGNFFLIFSLYNQI
jgi:hypothetical protein